MTRLGRDVLLVVVSLGVGVAGAVGVGASGAVGWMRVGSAPASRAARNAVAESAGPAGRDRCLPGSEVATAASAPASQGADALAVTIAELKRRLAAQEKNRAALQGQLEDAQERLARLRDGGARQRHEFDLTPADWADLARDGAIKYRTPCEREANWVPSAEVLQDLGLTPDDGSLLTDAYRRSYERSWSEVRALCAQALGSAEVADKLGRSTCTHLILEIERRKDEAGTAAAMKQVGEIRSGQRPAPGPGDPASPVLRLFLSLTGELKRFEADLAQSLGPEDAHRLAYSRQLCSNQNVFGGIGPRRDDPAGAR
ncbi:MAG: hypothetical protein HY906_00775 [Deltaproteobacteria bacterium]|nr:hypothetical protein [Deltaproteobacteria bacterium]